MAKTDWNMDDTVLPVDMNQIGQEINDNKSVAQTAQQTADSANTAITNHVNDKTNPHAVTKAQVGLGNVDNVKQATKAEFDAHVNNKSNPHGVTAAQVGALPSAGGTISANSPTPLVLKTGNVGWGYIPLFTDRDDQNRRTGYWGFPGGVGNEDHMTLKNERSGNLNLSTTGSGKVQANGKEIWHSGNFDPNSKMDAQNIIIKVSGNYAGFHADATAGTSPEFIGLIEGIRRGLIQLGDNIEIRRYADNGSTITNRVRLTDTELTVNGQTAWTNGNNAASLAHNGYQRLASGVIMQWGKQTNVDANTGHSVTFPIAFPNYCRSVVATTEMSDQSAFASINIYWGDKTKFSFIYNNSGSSSTKNINWVAFGY